MKIQIKNLQNIKRIRINKLKKKLEKVLRILKIKEEVYFVFCDNKLIKKLNRIYFKKKSSTDVIAFPLKDKYSQNFLGEVVISVEEVLKNSKIYKMTFFEELLLCSIHGILHLTGFKDYPLENRKKMQKEEERILKKVIIDDC